MKKITNFIVEKRYFILIIFIILSGISLYLSTKVSINYDIAKYLPNDSETKIGMDVMHDNFDELKESTLNVMFKGLNQEEKSNIKTSLENLKDVDTVLYDSSEKYNNEDYTLYVLNVKDFSDSKTSKDLYNKITDEYKDYDIAVSGSIAKANNDLLQMWIVVLAVVCAMIILILMCDSYTEPFLILFVILLAVAMNKGTNIIFPNVSHITNAIAAILQMALSMDYSIILLNRYEQEKSKSKDSIDAMKKALFNSCKAISGSSITTIVGLLALVFMSFTIGRDLGFVLAKGVLFSLLSIFLCLPALVILCDKLIIKTKKKTVHLDLKCLGKFSYRFKYPILIVFILLFGISFILKGGLGILYTDIEQDEVAKYFKEKNQMAIIYDNKYEDDIKNLCNSLKDDDVSETLCYDNTLNQKITYDNLSNKLESLGQSVDIDDYLIKIIYYNYYNKNSIKMSLNEFITFIENNIYSNEKLNNKVTLDTKENINKLKNFTVKTNINKLRDTNNMAEILGLNEKDLKDLYVLYNANNVRSSISIFEFAKFINESVLTDKKYAGFLSNEQKELIKKLTIFTDKSVINSEMNSKDLSTLFQINEDDVYKLLLLSYMNIDTSYKMDLETLINSTIYLKNNTSFLEGKDVSSLVNLKEILSNKDGINMTKLNKNQLKMYFSDISPSIVDTVYTSLGYAEDVTFTPYEFISFVLSNLSGSLPQTSIAGLTVIKNVMEESFKETKTLYTSKELKQLLYSNDDTINNLYALIMYTNKYEFKLSPIDFVNLILNNKDNLVIKDNIKIDTLLLVNKVMNLVNNDTKLNAKDMSVIMSTSESDVRLLYSLYEVKKLNKNVTISIDNLVNFILNDVSKNPKFANKFTNSDLEKISMINKITKDSLNKVAYSSDDLYSNLSKLNNNLDKSLVELVYIYNGSVTHYDNSYELSIEEFVNYLSDEVLKDYRFKPFIDEEMQNKIYEAKENVNINKKLLVSDKYSRMIINTTYDLESQKTFDFIQSIKYKLNSENKEIYLIGDSPMAYDMSQSFNSELNFITILTVIAIFIVVAFTFKSGLIPLILVLVIQCAVYVTMGILSVTGSNVYFIALLIVQSILMGATIDYAIVFTSYYKESRNKMNVLDSLINSYNKSIHTILTSALILIIVTLIVGNFASAIAAKICLTISEGTTCSVLLVLFILPAILAVCDRLICRKNYKKTDI